MTDKGAVCSYKVSHPKYGETEVRAVDRLRAITAAAKIWGVRWTLIARDCSVVRGEAIKKRRRKNAE